MNSALYYAKVTTISALVLLLVATTVGYDEMVYLVKNRPRAVWQIGLYLTLLLPFILPPVKHRISTMIDFQWRRLRRGLAHLLGRVPFNVVVGGGGIGASHQESAATAAVKRFVSPNKCQLLGTRLGSIVYTSIDEFKPVWIVSVWPGGSPFGLYVHGYLRSKGVPCSHVSVQPDSPGSLDWLVKHCNHDDQVLIVDSVFGSGLGIERLLDDMRLHMRNNAPRDVRVAAAFWKPTQNKTRLVVPNFFVEETSDWIVFGHEFASTAADNGDVVMGLDEGLEI